VHHNRPVAQHLAQHLWDHRRVRRGKLLAGPVRVEHAQAHRLEVPQPPDRVQILLRRQLADRVRGIRFRWQALPDRLLLLGAIDRAGRGQHHPAHPHIAHRLQHAHRAVDVGGVVRARIAHALRHADARRQVVDAVDPLQQRPQARLVVDVAACEAHAGRQPRRIARAEVVDHANAVAHFEQAADESASQKARAAGHQHVHQVPLPFAGRFAHRGAVGAPRSLWHYNPTYPTACKSRGAFQIWDEF